LKESSGGPGVPGIPHTSTLGCTRLYGFNPRYPFLKELKALLDKALSFYPGDARAAFQRIRSMLQAKT